MNELDYAKMIEIPVSTADIVTVGKQRKFRRKREEKLKDKLISAVNDSAAEAERAKEKSKADADLEDQLYKLKTEQDKTDLELEKLDFQRYFKEKELEYKKIEAEAKNAGSENGSDALNAYRYLNYKTMLDKAESMTDTNELQAFYDSITGINAEQAAEVLGYTNYKSLIQAIAKKQKSIREEAEREERIDSLYSVFVASRNKEYHGATYRRLVGDLKAENVGPFTRNELDEAYDRFKHDLQNGAFDTGSK